MHNHQQYPNVLWISLEDTSPRMGCYGDALARTPHIDRLAQEGTLYRNAFSTAGVCAPSRSAIITGMYATSIGAHHMRTEHTNKFTPELPTPYSAVPPACVKLIPEMFRARGYYCTNNWKTDYQFAAPMTAWDDNSTTAHWRNRDRDRDQPFFAVFNYDDTHETGMWPPEAMRKLKANFEERPLITDPDQIVLPPYLPDTPATRASIARQYDHLAKADEFVGRLLQELEDDGLQDNTIVILWSDHGEGLPRAKRWTYDAGIHVPLIVRWPGMVEADRVSEQLVSMIDLGPTVLSLAGISIPRHLHGQPFMGKHAEPRNYVFATRDRFDESYDKVRAVRDKKFKYIRNDYPDQSYHQWIPFSLVHPASRELWRRYRLGRLEGDEHIFFQPRPPEELYDCKNDPHELNNLADDPSFREELIRLRGVLEEWCNQYDVWGDISEVNMVETMWPGGVQPQTAKPLLIPINDQLPGLFPANEGSFSEPTAVMLHSSTQGASIAYTFEQESNPHWRLYTGPIILTAGTIHMKAKAVRIGYQDSEEAEGTYVVER